MATQTLISKNASLGEIIAKIRDLSNVGALNADVLAIANEAVKHEKPLTYIFNWVYDNIRFVPDPDNEQNLKAVHVTLSDRLANCANYTILISAILKALGLKHLYKVVGFGNGYEHIYVVTQNGIALDPVIGQPNDFFQKRAQYGEFNIETPYVESTYFSPYFKQPRQLRKRIENVKLDTWLENAWNTYVKYRNEGLDAAKKGDFGKAFAAIDAGNRKFIDMKADQARESGAWDFNKRVLDPLNVFPDISKVPGEYREEYFKSWVTNFMSNPLGIFGSRQQMPQYLEASMGGGVVSPQGRMEGRADGINWNNIQNLVMSNWPIVALGIGVLLLSVNKSKKNR